MSQIPSINPLDTGVRSPSSGFDAMRTEDFLRIIFTELANQDPFAPNDSAALLDQLNSIRSIESDLNLMKRLEALVFENKLSSATNLIGKYVQGLTPELQRVAGTVVSVLRVGDQVGLELDNGWRIRVESVETIHDMSPAQPQTPVPAVQP